MAGRAWPQYEEETGQAAGGPECPVSITAADLDHAVDRISQGVRRPPIVPGGLATADRRKEHPQMRTFAATEAGRAIMAMVLRDAFGRLEAVERISVVPRGSTMSRTIFAR